jgi:hypothetical protein
MNHLWHKKFHLQVRYCCVNIPRDSETYPWSDPSPQRSRRLPRPLGTPQRLSVRFFPPPLQPSTVDCQLGLQSLAIKFHPLLCFHSLTNCPVFISFVLTFMNGGTPSSTMLFARSFRSLPKERFTIPLQSNGSTLFLKTAGVYTLVYTSSHFGASVESEKRISSIAVGMTENCRPGAGSQSHFLLPQEFPVYRIGE